MLEFQSMVSTIALLLVDLVAVMESENHHRMRSKVLLQPLDPKMLLVL